MTIQKSEQLNSFGNIDLLAENPDNGDFIGLDKEKDKLKRLLNQTFNTNQNSLIAYIAPFGAGKSTILKSVEEETQDKYSWLTFETWRYANRDDLWNNFTVEVLAHFKDMPLIKAAKTIDGGQPTKMEIGLGLILIASIMAVTISTNYIWMTFKDDPFISAWLKYALPTLVSSLGIIGLATIMSWSKWLRRPDKITRVFQFEDVLKDSINKSKKPLVFVIDDADRAGEDGMVFLETLRTFMKKNTFKRSIVVIVPQANRTFSVAETSNGRLIDRALKIYDTASYFSPNISSYDFEKYYTNLQIHERHIKDLSRVSKALAIDYPGGVSLRLYKYALRETNLFLQSYPTADLVLVFMFVLSRHITTTIGSGEATIALNIFRHNFTASSMLPFLVALYDKEGSWRPNITQVNVFFDTYSREISFVDHGNFIDVNIDKKYEQLMAISN